MRYALQLAFAFALISAVVLTQAGGMMAAEEGHLVNTWAQLVDSMNDDALRDTRDALVAQARDVAKRPIVRRVYALEDVGKHRTGLDGRTQYLEPEIAETFALAMSDYGTSSAIAAELPLLAAAYRLTGEDVFRSRIVEQLAETATWSPLQRPGWTLYAPGHRLPPDGKDGNWLATGMGVRGIADALEMMPPDSMPDELRRSLEALLAREIASIADDWESKRPWFVRGDDPITNQWMLPTEGLVRACLVLGVDKHRQAYELGVANTLKALDSHGAAGEFEEGIGYAAFTITSMLHTAHAMAVAGDRRAIDHPFIRNCPTWVIHHLQPGGMLINCFDAGPARAVGNLRPLLSLLRVCTGSPVARWALTEQVGGPSDDLPGLLSRALPAPGGDTAPTLYASYERATRVNWRDSWRDDATGVWVRGGHATDQHDHHDRGHVNFISRGRPILIEAGTPAYHNPLIDSRYQSGVGHNVLQLGSVPPRKDVAPISVRRLDSSGGDVIVDATKCFDHLEKCQRTVRWTTDKLSVTDEVRLAEGKREVVLFRWHLGTENQAEIAGGGKNFVVRWPDATMALQASEPLAVSQEMLPDNTLESGPRSDASPDHLHTCVVVKSRRGTAALTLVTEIVPQD